MKMIEYGLRQRFARAIHEAVVQARQIYIMRWQSGVECRQEALIFRELGSNPPDDQI